MRDGVHRFGDVLGREVYLRRNSHVLRDERRGMRESGDRSDELRGVRQRVPDRQVCLYE